MNLRAAVLKFCRVAGLPALEPFIRLAYRENPAQQLRGIAMFVILPLAAVATFIGGWSIASRTIVTDSMQLPSPSATWHAGRDLIAMHYVQKKAEVSERQERLTQAVRLVKQAELVDLQAREFESESEQASMLENSRLLRKQAVEIANFKATGADTFLEQVATSLKTVFFGFLIATMIAVPVGIMCGINPWFNAAFTPFVQVFKPVSPLAWLPLAFLIIVWGYSGVPQESIYLDDLLGIPEDQVKAFLISAVTVALCSLWPTLVNTALGVASVNQDYLNVARVLKLSWWQKLYKIILPASLPLMFAGLRISLGVGWMVLIAADMLAQNPGLGKFVWDEFQNGSSLTYARIAFCVLVIGFIGLLLDRVMICLRNLVSFENTVPS